jgi:hypothetical protein
MNYELLKNANVQLSSRITDAGNTLAHIVVNDQFEHTFDAKSRISKAIDYPHNSQVYQDSVNLLNKRLNNGTYFFVNDELIDFRDSQYNGFVHEEANINNLINHIGITDSSKTLRSGVRSNTTHSNYLLLKKWSAEDFHIDGYLQGGDFTSNIIFTWNPFNSFVKGAFEIVRQICSNGMVGTSELINTKIPLINRWEEHLQIANIQIQNKVQGLVHDRLSSMGNERATVRHIQLINKHAQSRLESVTRDTEEYTRLNQIGYISDVKEHLGDYYTNLAFGDTNIASRAPSHLTMFDAWNLATEMMSHTNESDESTTGGLQRMANGLLFPAKEEKNNLLDIKPILSHFSDPDQAFFGI